MKHKSFKLADGYEYDLMPRYLDTGGHPGIRRLLDDALPTSSALLERFKAFESSMALFENDDRSNGMTYYWNNPFFPALDAVTLYGMLAVHKPGLYLEIGSGFSTKVARACVDTQGLATSICSIDPCPRADIDTFCDEVVRSRLEDADFSVFERLQENDILFFDGSHRSFTNSDVTVFFMDILPRVRPGVIIQIHDIPWPEDYPAEWGDRLYNEQYLLGCLLIYAPEKFEVLLPNAHISRTLPITRIFPQSVGRPGLEQSKRGGGSFWFTRKT